MSRIADTFGEKIGMSRRDIYRIGRKLTQSGLKELIQNHIKAIPLLANKNRLWPVFEWPLDPGENGSLQRKVALRALIFMLLVRFALPSRYTHADKSDEASAQETYIRKIVQTRELALNAAKNLPFSLYQFVEFDLPSIWQGNDSRTSNAKVNKIIGKRLERLEQYTHNALVVGYPEWQGKVIFQKDMYLDFADAQNQTGVNCVWGEVAETFDKREQFHQFIAILTKPNKKKKTEYLPPKRPLLKQITRSGPFQNIAGIDAAQFMERFAFRGGEFGSWLSQKDRQLSLEWATSAFMDLVTILGIGEKNIGRNSLGFAFGARGVGGYQAAAAHYDTVFNVINLTKLYGAGSVAHEWAHYIDFMLLGPKGVGSNTMTWLYGIDPLYGINLVRERRKNLVKMEERVINRLSILDSDQAEMAKHKLASCSNWEEYRVCFAELASQIFNKVKVNQYIKYIQDYIDPLICCKESNFHANARLLDEHKLKPYWTLPHELFARAFEKFVIDKLRLNGMHNDYLVKLYEHKISPYPDESEMAMIALKLEELIATQITE